MYLEFSAKNCCTVQFKGKKITFVVRPKTLDELIIQMVFFKYGEGEYASPVIIKPEVIFDVGAHIGSVSVYYSLVYPRAKIYAFEPLPENYNLLKINAGLNSDRIIPIHKGLGSKNGNFTYKLSKDSKNFGAGGFRNINCNRNKKLKLPVVSIKKFIRQEKIERIDILKIDTEGMEFDIITDLPTGILKKTKLIIGECHGVKDQELFLYLSRFFNLGFNKEYYKNDFNFVGVNKEISKKENA